MQLLLRATPAGAHELVPGGMGAIRFDQRPGAPVPLVATFHDERGQPVRLGDYFGPRPVVLTMNYLRCQTLCPLILDGLAGTLKDVPLALGDQFTVLTVGIDPTDGPTLARALQFRALSAYGRPAAEAGWHILTGDHSQIDRLADAVGFRYAYDADQDAYAHLAGVVLLAPDGQVSRYLYGTDLAPTDLRLGLVEAGQGRTGSLIDQVLLVRYRYEAETGRYTPIILSALRWVGAGTVLALGGLVALLWPADLRRGREPGTGA